MKRGLLVAFLLMAPSGLALGQPVPLGAEFQINTYTTSYQIHSSIALDGSGNFVVVWHSNGQDGSHHGVFGQRFDSAGAPLGGEFQVNTYTTSYQSYPSVALDGSGNFMVVWQSCCQDGSGDGVFGRRFDSAGAPLGGEFQVNTYTTSDQREASLAVDGSGNLVVVWRSDDQDGYGAGVFGRRFNSAGAPLGGEFQVNTYTSTYQRYPSIAVNGSGSFVVAWTSYAQDGDGYGVFGQRFNSAGVRQGAEFQVNTYTTSSQGPPSVALDDLGSFVVAWTSYAQDGDGYGVFGQGFDTAGAPLGGEFQVNTYTTYNQDSPAVAADGTGNFVVAWSSDDQDGFGGGVFGRGFDGAGAPLGGEFQINTYTTSSQGRPSLAADDSGNFVVAWSSYDQDGYGYGVFGQRFGGFTGCSDLDGDGLCDVDDVVVTSPLDGDTLDCSDPLVIRPAITWDAGNYEKFRVFMASDPNFVSGTVVTSGDKLFTSTSYTPPVKKWKSACKKALAANPLAPELFFKVFGLDVDASKQDINRKTFSQIVRADVTP